MKKVVVIGGGFAGSRIARKLENSFDVTLIDTKDYFEFTPGILRTIINPNHTKRIECFHKNYLKKAEFIKGVVESVDKKNVIVNNKKISYDYLVICSGSNYSLPIKEQNLVIASHISHLESKHEELAKAKNVAIIGGGLVGTELAAEICTAYKEKGITIIQAADRLIERNPIRASNYAKKFFEKRGVRMIFNEFFKERQGDYYVTDKGTKIKADLIFVCTGIHSNSDFMAENFSKKLNDKKQIRVDKFLNVVGERKIFAVGDVNDAPVEKTARNAKAEAKIAIKNILNGENKKERTYRSKITLMVISLGKWNGLFTWKKFSFGGIIPGILKTLIEWNFMRQYRQSNPAN